MNHRICFFGGTETRPLVAAIADAAARPGNVDPLWPPCGWCSTNVLLSSIAYPASVPGQILTAWRHGSVDVLLSASILEELRRVLPRLNHRHGLTASEIDDLVDVLSIQAEVIEPLPRVEPDLRDPDDPPVLRTLLAALKTSGADYLVTGDKDLLAMADRHPIVTPAKFWATHAGP